MSKRCCRGAPKITPKVSQTTAKTDPRGPQKEVKNSLQLKEQKIEPKKANQGGLRKQPKIVKKGFFGELAPGSPPRPPRRQKASKMTSKWSKIVTKSTPISYVFPLLLACKLLGMCVFLHSPLPGTVAGFAKHLDI